MDVVITVPMNFTLPGVPGLRGLDAWCAEGDAAGEEESGIDWAFSTGGGRPHIRPGERVYVVCEDRLRGYAPLVELQYDCQSRRVYFIRRGGAVAVTIPEKVTGFRGWQYRWWDYSQEIPFPDWRTADRRNKPRNVSQQETLF
jgi:hypothetical protein